MNKVSQELRAETQALASAGALDGKASAFDDESADLANMDALTRAIVARKVWQKTVSFRAIRMVAMSAEQVSDSHRST